MKHFNSQPSFWRKSAVAALALATVGLLPAYQIAEAAPTPAAPQTKPAPKPAPPKVVARKPMRAKPPLVRLWKKVNGKKQEFYILREENGNWVLLKDGKRTGIVVKKGDAIVLSPGKNGVKTQKLVFPQAPSKKPPLAPAPAPAPAPAKAEEAKKARIHADGPSAAMGDKAPLVPMNDSATRLRDEPTSKPVPTVTADPLSPVIPTVNRFDPVADPTATPDGHQISMNLNGCDVREALRAVFSHTKSSFEIDTRVQGKVTVALTNVSLDKALRSILRGVNATYRIDDGVYVVTPIEKPEA